MAMTAEERKEKMEAIYNQIDAGIEAVLNTEKWQEYLKFQARFYRYSFHNTMLILLQKPDASYVCGFREPVETTSLIGYKAVNVFDVSQTEGDALPAICQELQGSTDAAVFIIDRLLKVIKIPVTFDYDSQGKGAYYPVDNKIRIKPNLSDNQSAKTLAHEYAHSLLHSGKCEKPRDLKEIEAESVAFIVCNYFGLETNEYSFEYLASWSHGREKEEVKKLGMLIQKTAADIIDEISKAEGEITYLMVTGFDTKKEAMEKAAPSLREQWIGQPALMKSKATLTLPSMPDTL